MPALPAFLPYASGPARPLLRAARPRGRRGHGAHRLRPLDRLLRRSDREEAAQSLPAGLLGAVVRHGGLQPRLRLLPEPGHFQEPRSRAPELLSRCRRRSRAPRSGWAAPASPTPTTIRSSSWNTRSTRRPPAGRRGSRTSRSPRASSARSRASASSPAWTRPTSTSRPSPSASTRSAAPARCEPVLETLKYLVHETNVWTEITTLLIPGENDGDEEIEALTRWVAHGIEARRAAAFHRLPPRLSHARDAPTPLATLQRARAIGIRTGSSTSMSATSAIRRARRPCARPAARAASAATAIDHRHTGSTPKARCKGCGTQDGRRLRRQAGHAGARAGMPVDDRALRGVNSGFSGRRPVD